jgi:uncharacterized protein YeaO (DUF488 family)
MSIRIVQLGTPRAAHEGLRIGTVRRPPRGVPKSEFASRDYYDVWLPTLAPSLDLMAQAKAATTDAEWKAFVRHFRKQMEAPESSHVLELLAAMSHSTQFSVGCYCDDEQRCHRSILRLLLEERGAKIAE